MIICWIRTGTVRTRPPPSNTADVKAPMHILKAISPLDNSPAVAFGRMTSQ